ncbi:MAG: DUF3438 family protein [Pseudomonadota bacterium]
MTSVIVGLLMSAAISAAKALTIEWQRTPIEVDLVVGVEQMVVLPSDGAVGLPPELANPNVFKTLVTGGTAYWTALEAFDNRRIQVRLENGEYILFDVSARVEMAPPASVDMLQVVLPQQPGPNPMAMQGEATPGRATLFEVIRYAAQEVYSPKRLIAPVNGIRQVPVGLKGNMTALYDQGKHKGLILTADRAWAVDGLYVTTFIVTNEHTHAMTLDNRLVRHAPSAQRSGVAPHFVASAFFNEVLAPRGEEGSRTTLFVVTDQPIGRVVKGV